MSILHGVYGLGAFSSPLIATQFSKQRRWTFHFLTSMGVALINTSLLLWVCRLKTQDGRRIQCICDVDILINITQNCFATSELYTPKSTITFRKSPSLRR